MQNFKCEVCHQDFVKADVYSYDQIRPSIQKIISRDTPDWNSTSVICETCLDRSRVQYLQYLFEEERGELTALDERVLQSISEHEIVTSNIGASFDEKLTFGQRLSDRMATFGGSWVFLILFAIFMTAWITFNQMGSSSEGFDPFPFILLNLILSCLAAIQAPIIMMSQNRQEAKDRLHGENDYQVNLKAELEIRQLHMKIDQLLKHQWSRLLEIQQLQFELMRDRPHSISTTDPDTKNKNSL